MKFQDQLHNAEIYICKEPLIVEEEEEEFIEGQESDTVDMEEQA